MNRSLSKAEILCIAALLEREALVNFSPAIEPAVLRMVAKELRDSVILEGDYDIEILKLP